MDSRRYTVAELLDMRKLRTSSSLVYLAGKDKDLSEILRRKPSRNGCKSSSSDQRSERRSRTESSIDSEEGVYVGKVNARKPLTIESIPEDAILPMEWKYRGRHGSEMSSREPLSAPTGLPAQQSEGFQRFYKAVVSPTHVRVTAGGRIVPNTRGPPSPVSKRPKELDVHGKEQQREDGAAPAKPAMPLMAHPFPMFYPGFPPGMQPMPGMPGMPGMAFPMLPPGFPYPGMPIHPAQMEQLNAMREAHNRAAAAAANEPKGREPDAAKAADKVTLSHPDQFDRTKPFMLGGQMMMPMPGMFPPAFPGYVGMPPVAPGQAMPPPMLMPQGMPVPQAVSAKPPVTSALGDATNGRNAPPNSPKSSTAKSSQKMPVSSILSSQVTKNQIANLRATLKWHQDQLLYNKHQVDEQAMEAVICNLNNDIKRFEHMVVQYEEAERKHGLGAGHLKQSSMTSSARGSSAPYKSQSQSEESKESKATSESHHPTKSHGKQRPLDAIGLNSSKSVDASYGPSHAPATGLPSGAALAPPFQPRAASGYDRIGRNDLDTISQWEVKARESIAPRPSITPEMLQASEERLLSAAASAPSFRAHSGDAPQSLGVPYLVGSLPRSTNPYATQRIEYEYSRRLTEEERQARQYYWGKAPRPAGSGLPKFDGKNFYPPSPTKGAHAISENLSIRRGIMGPVENRMRDWKVADVGKHSEFSGHSHYVSADREASNKTPSPERPNTGVHSERQLHKAMDDLRISEDASSVVSSEVGQHETQSADQHLRRVPNGGSKLWQNMLKRGLTASDGLANTASSTNGHSQAPHKVGRASATLSPTFLNTIGESSRGMAHADVAREPDAVEEALSNAPSAYTKHSENRPPTAGGSLEQAFRSMMSKTRTSLSPRWDE